MRPYWCSWPPILPLSVASRDPSPNTCITPGPAGTTPCLEFSDPTTAYVDSSSAKRMGDVSCNYYGEEGAHLACVLGCLQLYCIRNIS